MAIYSRVMYSAIKLVILAVVSICFNATAYAKSPIRSIHGTVTKVSDGDTVQVTDSLGTKIKVRLYGVDAPETEKSNKKSGRVSKPGQPFGEEAYQALRSKIKDKQVRIDAMDIDRYHRVVGLVWLGNRNINSEMVGEGWAWAYRTYLDRSYASEFIGLEEKARRSGSGLWQQSNPQPPWEFRRSLKNTRHGSASY